MKAFDCDGVITVGIRPGPNDVIVTGRSFQEKPETLQYLQDLDIHNHVYFNPLEFEEKTRESSGEHKAKVLNWLRATQPEEDPVTIFFEDDPIQWAIIERECPWLDVVHIVHDLTEKENVRHSV